MPINTIEYATVLQTKLDQRAIATQCSGWMDANAGQVIYTGGKSIKVPTMQVSGLKDYDKDAGYPTGAVTLSYESLTMGMDRSTSFLLDSQDVIESNFMASATMVASTFQRDNVVPEVDAYRYSKLAAYGAGNKTSYTPDKVTIFDALIDDIAYVQNLVGENEPLVISINSLVRSQLDKVASFTKMLSVSEFNAGAIKTQVKTINDIPLLSVPNARMQTSYIFADGATDGQKEGGFKIGSDAKTINWIILPKRVAIAVSKQDKLKIIDPDTYQKADAWFIGYRRYHELWVLANQIDTIKVNVQG